MFDYKKYLAEGGIESKLEIRGSVLTKNDRKAIASMVIEESYQGITLTEAKTNESLKEDIAENIVFYNDVKLILLEEAKKQQRSLHEGVLKTILTLLGGIKDTLTATKVGQDLTGWIRSRMSKFAGVIEKKANSLFKSDQVNPGTDVKQVASKAADLFQSGLSWFVKTFSYEGIAKLFAMIRYRKRGKDLTKEQVDCMKPAAKKTVAAIYVILVIAFIAKFVVFAAPIIAKGGLAALQSTVITLVTQAGIWGGAKLVAGKAFSTFSAMKKAQDAAKYAKQAKAGIGDGVGEALEGFDAAWNVCPL